MSNFDFVNDYINGRKKLLKLIEKSGEALIAPLFQELFNNSSIVKVRWTQSTPSFNDGDPCEFTVYDASYIPEGLDLNDQDSDEEYDEDKEDLEWENFHLADFDRNSWIWKGESKDKVPPYVNSKNLKAIKKFEEIFNQLEEVLERIFGNGSEIKVTMNDNGDVEFEVTECYDDY